MKHDVPDYALIMGVPGKQTGWVCACGVRLPENGTTKNCAACGRSYLVEGDQCLELDEHNAAMQQAVGAKRD